MATHRSISERVWGWLVERAKIEPIITPTVTKRALTPMYCLGGLTFFFFVLLAVTGVMLALYYQPSPDTAYESVVEISTQVQYGWLIRGIHFYAANGMLITAILHMIRVYFTGAYKKPRELNWIVGVGLGAFTVMAGFTGYVLRWDQEALGAAGVGYGIASSIPQIGSMITYMIWGRNTVDTCGHFFASHVLLVPGLLIILMACHFWMIRRHEIAEPL